MESSGYILIFSTFFWKECDSTCESSPHLIDSCMSKTQTQKTEICKLMHYLWSKVSREDSSAQQGGVSRGFVKLCESGIRSGTQNFAEGLFLWAPAASAHGLFFLSLLLLLLSGAHSKCELSVSRAQRGTPTVLPCLCPVQGVPFTTTNMHQKNEALAIAENWACKENLQWGIAFGFFWATHPCSTASKHVRYGL